VSARSSVLFAWLEGWRRVFGAPVLVIGLLALMALRSVEPHESRAELLSYSSGTVDNESADAARTDAQLFTAETFGIGWVLLYPTYGLGRSGALPAGMLTPVLVPMLPLSPPVLPTLHTVSHDLVGMAVLLFLAGGVLDRLARGRPVRAHGFFSACGGCLFRFLQLGVPLGLLYWLLLRWIYPWMIGPLFVRLAGGLSSSHTVELIRYTIYGLFTLAMVIVSVIGDYAMVRTVVEDRRSALGSLIAGARFVRRRLLRVLALYAATAVLPTVVFFQLPRLVNLSALPEPLMLALIAVIMMLIQLAYLASATVFFQGELAHAHYTAAPSAVWPESPAAEAIRNLTGRTS